MYKLRIPSKDATTVAWLEAKGRVSAERLARAEVLKIKTHKFPEISVFQVSKKGVKKLAFEVHWKFGAVLVLSPERSTTRKAKKRLPFGKGHQNNPGFF